MYVLTSGLKEGALYEIVCKNGSGGKGLFLGRGRGWNCVDYFFLVDGKITTFDSPYWEFKILSE